MTKDTSVVKSNFSYKIDIEFRPRPFDPPVQFWSVTIAYAPLSGIGQEPDIAAEVTARVCEAVKIPVVIKLTPDVGLHPSLEKLAPIWEARRLAIVQGVGYPDPNLSHFRSIEIWDSGSDSDELIAIGEGKIQAMGPAREVVTKPLIDRLYQTDVDILHAPGDGRALYAGLTLDF